MLQEFPREFLLGTPLKVFLKICIRNFSGYFFQKFLRGFPPRITAGISSGDFLQKLLREFGRGIPPRISSRRLFCGFLLQFLRKFLQICTGNFSKNFFSEFLQQFHRNSSSDSPRCPPGIPPEFLRQFLQNYSGHSHKDFFRVPSVALEFLQKLLWRLSRKSFVVSPGLHMNFCWVFRRRSTANFVRFPPWILQEFFRSSCKKSFKFFQKFL